MITDNLTRPLVLKDGQYVQTFSKNESHTLHHYNNERATCTMHRWLWQCLWGVMQDLTVTNSTHWVACHGWWQTWLNYSEPPEHTGGLSSRPDEQATCSRFDLLGCSCFRHRMGASFALSLQVFDRPAEQHTWSGLGRSSRGLRRATTSLYLFVLGEMWMVPAELLVRTTRRWRWHILEHVSRYLQLRAYWWFRGLCASVRSC